MEIEAIRPRPFSGAGLTVVLGLAVDLTYIVEYAWKHAYVTAVLSAPFVDSDLRAAGLVGCTCGAGS